MNEIKTKRAKLCVTQAELAEMLGVTQNYIAQIETGRKPIPAALSEKLDELLRAADADRGIDWKQRALIAEAKLESLKQAMLTILDRY